MAAAMALTRIAHAGMPSVRLTDIGQMRTSALSFFAAGFLVSAWGIQSLWNVLQRDFPRLPRLTFKAALGATFLWGILFVLVLTMVSGARELMTPGAWEKHGLTYKLVVDGGDEAETAPSPLDALVRRREQQLQKLHVQLLDFAARHDGEFPPDGSFDDIDPESWKLPDQLGASYLYVSGRQIRDVAEVLAYEPQVYDDRQLVLWTDGRVQPMSTSELRHALNARNTP